MAVGMPGSIPRVKSVEAIRLHFQSHHTVKVISLQTHLPDKQSFWPNAEEPRICLLPQLCPCCCEMIQNSTPASGFSWEYCLLDLQHGNHIALSSWATLEPLLTPATATLIGVSLLLSMECPIPCTASNFFFKWNVTRPLKCSATHIYLP